MGNISTFHSIQSLVFRCSLTVVALPIVAALSLVTPGGAVSGQQLTLVWISVLGGPTIFTLLMVDSAVYTLETNVATALLSTTVTLPVVQDATRVHCYLVDCISDMF